MSYLVIGKKVEHQWDVEVQGVGQTHADELAGIEPAARELLRNAGKTDADDADLQLLMPDFEVDLSESRMPHSDKPYLEIISGLIALLAVIGALVFVVTRLT